MCLTGQDINRFFVAEGDSSGVTNPTGSTGEEEVADFDAALDDAAMCVFKSGGVNEDLLDSNDPQILFYLDLDNECIVDKQSAKNR